MIEMMLFMGLQEPINWRVVVDKFHMRDNVCVASVAVRRKEYWVLVYLGNSVNSVSS